MKKNLLLLLITLSTLGVVAQNKTYYINQNTPANGGGSDANSGLSPTQAWATIGQANSMNLQPGDKILLFSDGPWHTGNFSFNSNDVGTPANPIVISSYGPNATANIWAGGSSGFSGDNTGSVVIKNINFYGGRTYTGGASSGNGISFLTDGASTYRSYIMIDSCRLEGFGSNGIFMMSKHNSAAQSKGFSDITIKNTLIINCKRTGLFIGAYSEVDEVFSVAYVHKNILIENVRASHNAGDNTINNTSTGNGILVSSAENVLIEKCVADFNAFENANPGAGPAGIWFYNVKDGIIQHCEAFGNYAGNILDGNGFGIDGGCHNCIIQYCYSHDNEGAGFGMFEFGSPNGFTGNTIRYNISQNDGRKNSFGALKLWGVSPTNKLNNSSFYNNSIYLNAANLVNGSPVGVRVLTNNMNNVKIMNNLFYLADPSLSFTKTVDGSNSPTNVLPTEVLLLNNFYYKSSGTPSFEWGDPSPYSSLAAWRAGTSQEIHSSTNYGYTTDPGYTNPGGGTAFTPLLTFATNGSANPTGLGTDIRNMTAYKLTTGANAIGTALDLNALFGTNVGTSDYYGFALNASVLDNGAHQTGTALPLAALRSFTANSSLAGNIINWAMYDTKDIIKFDVEARTNATEFSSVSGTILATDRLNYTYTHYNISEGTVYYRIKGTDKDGMVWYSAIKAVTAPASNTFRVYPNPVGSSSVAIFNWGSNETVDLKVYDTNAQVKFTQKFVAVAGNNEMPLSQLANLPPSTYIINISGTNKSLSHKVIKQ